MSIQAHVWAMNLRTGHPAAKSMLHAMANYVAPPDSPHFASLFDESLVRSNLGVYIGSVPKLVAESDVCERSVQYMLRALVDTGVLLRGNPGVVRQRDREPTQPYELNDRVQEESADWLPKALDVALSFRRGYKTVGGYAAVEQAMADLVPAYVWPSHNHTPTAAPRETAPHPRSSSRDQTRTISDPWADHARNQAPDDQRESQTARLRRTYRWEQTQERPPARGKKKPRMSEAAWLIADWWWQQHGDHPPVATDKGAGFMVHVQRVAQAMLNEGYAPHQIQQALADEKRSKPQETRVRDRLSGNPWSGPPRPRATEGIATVVEGAGDVGDPPAEMTRRKDKLVRIAAAAEAQAQPPDQGQEAVGA